MLTLTMVRSHWRDLLATIIALSLGVAISAASMLVFASATPQVPDRFAGTDAIVQAPAAGKDDDFIQYLPWDAKTTDELATRLSAVPGVAAAVPMRSFYAQLVLDGKPAGTPDAADPEGRSWSAAQLAPFGLTAGKAPVADNEVAVSDEYAVEVGQQVTMLTALRQQTVTVTGTVDGSGLYFSDSQARKLGGGASVIGLTAKSGTSTDQLAAAVKPELPSGTSLLTGSDRTRAEPEGTARTRYLGVQLLTLMLVLACFAAIFVVSQTFALAAAHRRRDVALLRALGGTPGQVHRMMLRESAVVGVVGALIGGALGAVMAPLLGRGLVAAGLEPVGFEVRINPAVLLGIIVLGPILAVAATWATGRRSGRVSALEAIRSAQVENSRLGWLRLSCGVLVGIGAIGASIAAASADPSQIASLAAVATLAAVAAITLLGPLVLPPLVRLFTWPLSGSRKAGGMLVRGSMISAVSRTVSTMAPVLATVALATLVLGYVETGRTAYGTQDVPDDTTAVVAPSGTPGLTEDTVAAVRTVSGSELNLELPTQVYAGTGKNLVAVPAVGLESVPTGRALVGRDLAKLNDWKVGDSIPVTMADGAEVAVQISALKPATTDGPSIAVARSTVRQHDGTALTPRLLLTGVDASALGSVTRPGVRALSASEYVQVADEDEYRLLKMFVLVALGLALGYTLLSIANTLLMATAARARDLSLLRLSGATPNQVISALIGEALMTVALGTTLGLLAGLAGVFGIRSGLSRDMGQDVAVALPWGWMAVLVAACAVLAGAASVWPAWRMVRRPPAPMTQGSE